MTTSLLLLPRAARGAFRDRHPRQSFRPLPGLASFFSNSSLTTTHHPLPTLFLFNHLRTLLHSRNSQLLSHQSLPHSLHKTPGGGGGIHAVRVKVILEVSWFSSSTSLAPTATERILMFSLATCHSPPAASGCG